MSELVERLKKRCASINPGRLDDPDALLLGEAAAVLEQALEDKNAVVTDMIALEDALTEWPKLPPLRVLRNLGGHMSKWPDDWERGKAMQSELGLQAIPPKTEYECGAGFWDRITNGAWRNVSTESPEA